MNDLRHDPDAPDAIDPVAERTAYLRQWQPVPPGVQPWGRTVMHTPDGGVYTNVDPPTPEPPDLRTVGDRVAECEQAIAALQDETGSQSWNMRQLLGRVETLEKLIATSTGQQVTASVQLVELAKLAAEHEGKLRHVEALLHRLLNPGEQEDGNDLNDIAARLQRLESMFQSLMYASMSFSETDEERCKVMAAYSVHQYFHGPGEQESGEQTTPAQDHAAILSDFYSEVCREAEGIMAQSGMVSGAHWNAMRRVLQRHGVEVSE